MGPTSRPTGRPTTSTARRPGCSTTGPRPSTAEYQDLGVEDQAALKARLKEELRRNTYDPATGDLTVSPLRAEAMAAVAAHYAALFGHDPALDKLRDAYAIPADAIKTPERQGQLNAFFFWASWACSTDRPGSEITYTNNWPSEALIDNHPSGQIVVWSVVSFVLLLAGIGALAWYFAVQDRREDDDHELPAEDPLLALHPTPSMRATLKYFWVVTALIVAQVGLGAVTAHYGVEGSGFYGIPLAKWLPLQRDPHLAHADRHLLDRHGLAGHRPVHGPGRLGPRAEVPAAGSQFPVRLPADHRRRVDGRPVACRPAAAGQRGELLVRPPGLRVR